MLKVLFIAGLTAIALFVLACLGLALLMALIILTTPKDDGIVIVRRKDIAPLPDGSPFSRLASEAKAFAARPFVTTFLDASDGILLTTVSDPFDKRVYAMSNRRDGKTLRTIICVYEDGRHEPVARAEVEIPVSQVDWNAYHADLKDVADNGSTLQFNDEDGRAWRVRFPKRKGRHHA